MWGGEEEQEQWLKKRETASETRTVVHDLPSEHCALTAKCRNFYSLLSAVNPALLFLLEWMNWLNIYPGSWTKFYSLGRLWPSLEWVWICLHHSCRHNLTGFCWASLLVCMKHENAAPNLSHTFMWEPFSLFFKSSQAHYDSLKNR